MVLVRLLREELLQQSLVSGVLPFLLYHVQRVQEGVERRVERQHEDGHGHVDLARDGSSGGGQQAQRADGEPAEEIGNNDHRQSARDLYVT